jgi:hypothetical protein
MSILISVINDELDRNLRAQVAYRRELSQYPEGSVVVKTRKSIPYFYLAYRDSSNHVRTDYIGNAQNPKVKLLQQQILKRKELLSALKKMQKEELQMRKMLKKVNR